MTYPSNFEQKIGFDKMRLLVDARCLSPLGKERVEQMHFSTAYDEVMQQLHQTNEFVQIQQERDDFPANYFFDIRPALKRIRIEGTFMDEGELFDLRRSLDTIRAILTFLQGEEGEEQLYPSLKALAQDVMAFPQLIRGIDQILDKFGRIKDNASNELLQIRREMSRVISGISRNLNSILRSAQSEGIVDKDVSPTMRDGRLVIPVIPAYKRKIRGIVHDESASGKTVFIEPAEVVEANNRVRELEGEEHREMVRILTHFTNELRPHLQEIGFAYEFLAEIDFIRAKAILAIELNALLPKVENACVVEWYNAIHPLLYLSLKRQSKQVIPLEITLQQERRILIISGPNAGGKSVCLKTVGLLQYMIQCGMLVPMADHSHMGIFADIFIDIGDEQSIENDLSTYSSHLTNMKHFVRHCNAQSLLLIDEFGGGTEPQIGGAIAESLLDRFNKRGAFGVITTHYQNLKHMAQDTEGIINGAMLYDRHLMQPLFKLAIGNPGSSFAVEIARKIGLPEEVIADASEKVGADYISMDKYLQDIVRDKRYWESKRQNIRQREKRLEEITAQYDTKLKEIDQQRKEWMLQAKEEAKRLLAESNARIESTIREIKEAQADKEKTREIRRKLEAFKENITEQEQAEEGKIAREMERIKEREARKKSGKKRTTSTPEKPSTATIAVGDAVKIKGGDSVGEVIELQGKSVVVALGMIKSTLKLNQVERVSHNLLKKSEVKASTFVSASTADEMREKSLHFKREIDVRGLRGDEALQAVTYFIDDAILVSCDRVRILHGTGTGALRQLIRQYLKSVPGVLSFQDEHVQFGGAGITVVELA